MICVGIFSLFVAFNRLGHRSYFAIVSIVVVRQLPIFLFLLDSLVEDSEQHRLFLQFVHFHTQRSREVTKIFSSGFSFLIRSSKVRPCSNSPKEAQCIQIALFGKLLKLSFLPFINALAFGFHKLAKRMPSS